MINQTVPDTICALATPAGYGGVGIVRVSGRKTLRVMEAVLHAKLNPRHAAYLDFYSLEGETIDKGIAIFFPAPHSFTGEDVLELQAHGGPVILNMLLIEIMKLEVRAANPGEFSERAFFNGKLDLAQAEAVHDIIFAASEQAVKSAGRSLRGEFSHKITNITDRLTELRIELEAAIDFPDEDLDLSAENRVEKKLLETREQLKDILANAQKGSILREGLNVVIAGRPNAGKSSLLNVLAGSESAIVTDIPGTTRDILKEHININGIPLNIIDTAGIRDSSDVIEQEGVRRAWGELHNADMVVLLIDDSLGFGEFEQNIVEKVRTAPAILVFNKIDKTSAKPGVRKFKGHNAISASIKNNQAIELIQEKITQTAGFNPENEGLFMARGRHIKSITRALSLINRAYDSLSSTGYADELIAEDLRVAANHLGEITGKISSDELLGKIFSEFCIGK